MNNYDFSREIANIREAWEAAQKEGPFAEAAALMGMARLALEDLTPEQRATLDEVYTMA